MQTHYCHLLLVRIFYIVVLAFGEGNVRGRIKNVLNYKKPSIWVIVLSIVIVTTVGIGLMANPKEKGTLNPIDSESEQRELIYSADVDGDGRDESIFIEKSQIDNMLVTLSICDSSGTEIWNRQLHTSHAGWDSLFLCELDDKQYILSYIPYMGQGYAEYSYTLFTLEGGSEKIYRSNTLEFDINGINELNPPKMIAYANEVNELLEKSVLLLSSEGGEYYLGPAAPDPFFERYSWLDQITEQPELYDDDDDLQTKLTKYSKYAVEKHKQFEEKYFPNQSDTNQGSESDDVLKSSPADEINEAQALAMAKQFCNDMTESWLKLERIDMSSYLVDNLKTHLVLNWIDFDIADRKQNTWKQLVSIDSVQVSSDKFEKISESQILYKAFAEIKYTRYAPSVNGIGISLTLGIEKIEGHWMITSADMIGATVYLEWKKENYTTIEEMDRAFLNSCKESGI